MQYLFNELTEVDAKDELVKLLNKCTSGQIVIGENSVQQMNYYFIEGYSNDDKSDCFGVAILSEGHGIKPEVLHIQEKSKLLVGVNRNVYLIDYIKKEVEQVFSFESLFYNFLLIEGYQIIIAIYETGAVALDYNFGVVWNFIGDIICEYKLVEDLLTLFLFDGQVIKLSITDGNRYKH